MAVANIRIPKKFGPIPIANRIQNAKKTHDKIFDNFSLIIFLL